MWYRRPKQDPIATYKQTHQLYRRKQHSWFEETNVSTGCPRSMEMLMMGFGMMGCIDYRICLMGHNSLQGCQGSVMPLNCELYNPHKSTHNI